MRAALFGLYALAITLMPPLVVAWNHGADMPFWFLAGDAYLYLGIGEASSGLTMSFDGERPTNGFHPFWQVWVRVATALAGDPLGAMTLVAWSAIFCTAGGVLLLGAAIRRATGSWLLAMLVVPGVYFLVIGQALRNLPVWAFFDGMEAGLAFLLSGWLLLLAVRPGTRPLILGLVMALLVLTRLDEVFVPAAVALAVMLWPGRPVATRFGDAVRLVAPSVVAVALFIGWSLWSTGLLTPVSGAAKGEGALLQNAWVTLATFLAPIIDLREGLTAYTADRGGLLGGAFRVVQLIVPALFALVFLVVVVRRLGDRRWAPVLAGICGGVLIKAAYNIVSVNYWHQASWYFALAMALMTFGAAVLLAPAVTRATAQVRALGVAALAALTLLHASLWSATLMGQDWRLQDRDFWAGRAATEAAIRAAEPDPRMIEFGDGMLNFTFDFPVRHGFVFAGDAQSLLALREGRLLRDAWEGGYRLLSSYEYLRVPPGAEDWDSERIRAFLMDSFLDPRVKSELAEFDFEMILVHRPTDVPVIRLIRRG